METGRRLVAGSRNRNEFVVINADDFGKRPQLTCYEYERREGSQACPRCKTRYKRHKGSARVEGDEDEDGDDDIYKELNYFNFVGKETVSVPDPKLYGYPYAGQRSLSGLGIPSNYVQQNGSNIPLLTYGEEVDGISCDDHALIIPPYGGFGGQVHQGAASGTSASTQLRPINPNKDISVYGYGTVAWKNRIDEWKTKQLSRIQQHQLEGGDGGYIDRYDPDNSDLSIFLICLLLIITMKHPGGSDCFAYEKSVGNPSML
ncbi:hypothetical protein OPV22_029873 [Ensete ventricosum]|uniref:Cellulose synthase RING-type zinc finger domain-containing protein n=1 Tax=Ensete ventricosum TaxID=4639 RepID=A0AAV8Q4K2_ENSVE|nr:hypothetical protein OPV22_029873 [Ensete ventricosum]